MSRLKRIIETCFQQDDEGLMVPTPQYRVTYESDEVLHINVDNEMSIFDIAELEPTDILYSKINEDLFEVFKRVSI